MRKSRLVILPTKCLNQIGFLLLFLSCPAIGDWGRIRPESEESHRAIQVAREGTCGLQRDLPDGFTSVPGYDFDHCRIGAIDPHSQDVSLPKTYNQPAVPQTAEVKGFNSRVNSQMKHRQTRDEMREQGGSRRERGSTRRGVFSNESRQQQQQERRQVPERSSAERRTDTRRQAAFARSRSLEGRGAVFSQRSAMTVSRSRSLSRVDERRSEATLARSPTPTGRHDRSTSRRETEGKETRRTHQGRDYGRQVRTRDGSSDIKTSTRREESLDGRRERFNENFSADNRKTVNEARFARTNRHTTERDTRTGERLAAKTKRNDVRRTTRTTENETRILGQLQNERQQQRKERDASRATRRSARRIQTQADTRTSNTRSRLEGRRIDRQTRTERTPETGHINNINLVRELVPQNVHLSKAIPVTDALIPKAHDHFQEKIEKETNNQIQKISQKQLPLGFGTYDSNKMGDWTLNCVMGALAYYFTMKQVKTV